MSLTIPPPPRITRDLVLQLGQKKWSEDYGDEPMPKVWIFSVRGYRATTMGPTKENDPGIYDDMMCLVTPDGIHAVNANLDPSRYGWNPGVGKPYGILQPGVWWFYPGAHRGVTPAFRQADDAATAKQLGIPHSGKFFVERCWGRGDKRNYFEWGHQQVNIHLGGFNTTSSWLCLTLPPTYGKAWLQEGWDALAKHNQKIIPNILVEGPVN